MKGVILAGGTGTRLSPLTQVANKHLLPVYDKPMVLYPLETLKSLGIKDILVVSGGEHVGVFAEFLGDGSEYGVNLTYKVQKGAGGIAYALGLAKDFVGGNDVAVILGDNLFEEVRLPDNYKKGDCVIYGKQAEDAERFGVLDYDKEAGVALGIEEKPKKPKTDIAVTGLYIYPPDVFEFINTLKPSARGELEITDVNNHYIKKKKCRVEILKGFWSDAGTFDSLLRSANWVKVK